MNDFLIFYAPLIMWAFTVFLAFYVAPKDRLATKNIENKESR